MVNIDSKKINIIEKIINFLLNILIGIFGIILLVTIYTGIQTKIMNKNYTDFFGYSIFEVQTGSMEKAISAGDWIITKITQDVKLNDIITYEIDGEYVTHRIIEVYNGTYVTKGDANNTKDDPIDQSQIVGKKVAKLAGFGILRKTIFNPAVLITLIITLVLFSIVVKKNKEDDKKNSNKPKTMLVNEISEVLEKRIIPVVLKFIKSVYPRKKIEASKEQTKQVKVERKIVEVPNVSNRLEDIPVEIKEEKVKEISSQKNDEISEADLENELGKTSFFRVISVNDEVDEKYKVEKEELIENTNIVEDEDSLDKTLLYRNISVDISELDSSALLEIANNMKNSKQSDSTNTPVINKDVEEDDEIILEDSSLTKINLNFLKDRKGDQNIIDTAMLIKKEEINRLVKVLINSDKVKVSETGIRNNIKNTFTINYIDAKYYNYYEEDSSETSKKSLMLRLEKTINNVSTGLVKKYTGSNRKYEAIVNEYAQVFMLIANIEKAKDSIEEIGPRRDFYKKLLTRYSKELDEYKIDTLIKQIIIIQKKYAELLKSFIEKLETNLFNLNIEKIATKNKIYGLKLEHNISFSKVYSSYVIDKTYEQGIVAEDKISVLVTLLLIQLINDMTTFDFGKKYVFHIPETLYDKEKKFEKLLKMIEDKYSKENTAILVTFQELLKHKVFIKKIKKSGYKFALVFSKDSNIKEKDRGNIYIADYIFVNKKLENLAEIVSLIPDDLKEKVIYEDISNKVGDFGSEEV